MTPVRVGLCFNYRTLSSPHLARKLESLSLLVFPELFDGGYAALRRGVAPHTSNDPLLSDFVTVSMTVPGCIVAGSISYADRNRKRTNTSLVFQRGRLIHRYDKIHLFRPAGEDRYFVPGSTVRPFTLNAAGLHLRAGVIVCYDLRFPELVRSLAQQGMRILVVPARWPVVRDDAWQSLLKARAIENQIFVIGCNAHRPEGGYSYAFDPLGKRIFSNRAEQGAKLETFELDLDVLNVARAHHRNIDEALLLKERPPLRQLKSRPARGNTTSRGSSAR